MQHVNQATGVLAAPCLVLVNTLRDVTLHLVSAYAYLDGLAIPVTWVSFIII
jgi:hypothetical protein